MFNVCLVSCSLLFCFFIGFGAAGFVSVWFIWVFPFCLLRRRWFCFALVYFCFWCFVFVWFRRRRFRFGLVYCDLCCCVVSFWFGLFWLFLFMLFGLVLAGLRLYTYCQHHENKHAERRQNRKTRAKTKPAPPGYI